MSRRKLVKLVVGEHRKQRGDRMDGELAHPMLIGMPAMTRA